MVLLNWYINFLYCNNCISCLIQFVPNQRSCTDTVKAVNGMYVQHHNSEEDGHFVSSKARPCLKVWRAPNACHKRSEATSFGPSVLPMVT